MFRFVPICVKCNITSVYMSTFNQLSTKSTINVNLNLKYTKNKYFFGATFRQKKIHFQDFVQII